MAAKYESESENHVEQQQELNEILSTLRHQLQARAANVKWARLTPLSVARYVSGLWACDVGEGIGSESHQEAVPTK